MGFDTTLRLLEGLKTAQNGDPSKFRVPGMDGVAGKYLFEVAQTRKTCWIYKIQAGKLEKLPP